MAAHKDAYPYFVWLVCPTSHTPETLSPDLQYGSLKLNPNLVDLDLFCNDFLQDCILLLKSIHIPNTENCYHSKCQQMR